MFLEIKDLSSMQLAKYAVARFRTDNSRLRRAAMKKRLDYYYGKQLTYLDELITKQFEKPERLKLQKEFINITEMIINELAVLYSQTPKRELIDTEDSVKAFYSEICEDGKINQVMSLANKLTKLCKTVLIRPVWRDEQIEYDILTPNMFDVIQDPNNPTKALGIVYANQVDFVFSKQLNNDDTRTALDPFSLPNTVYNLWTNDRHFTFTYTMSKNNEVIIDILGNENNPDNINPYGVMPFVCLYDGMPVDNFFVEGGDDLINANEINNIKLVEKNHLTKMQSFSQLVRKGADNTKDAIIVDPSMCLDIPADDDVRKGIDIKYISPNARLTEIEEDISKRLSRVAIKHKLNPEMFVASGNRSSADALQMQAYYLGKVINADKAVWAYFEHELYEMTCLVNNYHNTILLPEDAELFIDYKDIELPSTIEQDDAHNLIMFQNGLISKADWLMRENPDVRSKEQAENMLEEIKEEKIEAMQEMVQNGLNQMQPKEDTGENDQQNNAQENDQEKNNELENG